MAWQLIYTSAPRLLEAGCSGFGTVARHRQISSLLVSATERASQFARLPGLGADRVIYCHRIVAVAGGRFHVLSCIRDAGADYTGRTNHIAHHLIAEPREVAALGTRGASPADVLLAMPWITGWDEPPRFLEAADEIALDHFAPQTGAHWTQATGDANHAWLLVTGEASRGAYLLSSPGTDLRGLFATSLRLSPDRLWQIPFTTALQPSDEASDFRWIGLEADSTLRAQAESSGRPVLDLTRPDTLPAPQVPANALTIGIPRPSSISSAAPARTPSAVRAQPPRQIPKATPQLPAPTRSHRAWIIGAGTMALLLAIGFGVIRPRWMDYRSTRERREALVKQITDWRVFTPQASEFILHLSAEKLSPASQVLDEVGKAVAALKPASFEKLRDCKGGGDIQQMVAPYGIEVPGEFVAFADTARRLHLLNAELAKPSASERAAFEALEMQRGVIDSIAKEVQAMSIFSDATRELRANHERAEATALLALLHPRGSAAERLPPSEGALIREAIGRGRPADGVAAKMFSDAEKLMADWVSVQSTPTDRVADDLNARSKSSQNIWPEWLLRIARDIFTKSRGEAAAAAAPVKVAEVAPKVPLYIFNHVAAIEEARFPELEKGLTYSFRASLEAVPVELKYQADQGTLRRLVTEPPLFGVGEPEKKVSAKPAAENLSRPFVLIARNADGREVLEIWVVNESDKPLLARRTGGLRRAGDSLNLDAAKLALPGVPTSRMTLTLPPDCAAPGKKNEPLIVKEGSVDLSLLRAEIERPTKDTQQRIQTLEAALTPATDAAAKFRELKAVVFDEVNKDIANWVLVERARMERKERDQGKRSALFKPIEDRRLQRFAQRDQDFGKDTDPLFRQAGGCVKAFCQEATFQGHDALFTAGAELAILDPSADAKTQLPKFAAAAAQLEAAKRGLFGTNEKGRYDPGMKALKEIIDLLSPETAQVKDARARLNKTKAELLHAPPHPLLSDKVPPGVYRLSVLAEGGEIPLMDIEIPR